MPDIERSGVDTLAAFRSVKNQKIRKNTDFTENTEILDDVPIKQGSEQKKIRCLAETKHRKPIKNTENDGVRGNRRYLLVARFSPERVSSRGVSGESCRDSSFSSNGSYI